MRLVLQTVLDAAGMVARSDVLILALLRNSEDELQTTVEDLFECNSVLKRQMSLHSLEDLEPHGDRGVFTHSQSNKISANQV